MYSNKRLLTILIVILVSILACNLPTKTDANNQSENQINNERLNTADQNQDNTPVEPPPDPEPQPQPEPDVIKLPEVIPTDPCSIIPPEVAQEILGMPVEGIEGPGTCVYSTGTVSITIGILESEQAKFALVDQILQLQTDCSMSFSYSSDQPDPTPLPPEADPLLELSMQELMDQSLTLQQGCGGSEFEVLTDYGPGVYLLPFELFMPGGLVSIAGEDYTLTILYTDLEKDSAAAVEVARQLLELLVTGK